MKRFDEFETSTISTTYAEELEKNNLEPVSKDMNEGTSYSQPLRDPSMYQRQIEA